MNKSTYTTQMSGNGKMLLRRFEKINGKPMWFSKVLTVLCSIILVVTFALSTIVMAKINGEKKDDNTLYITNNGEKIDFENKPFIKDGEVYVPLRELFTALGFMESPDAKMEWQNGAILIYLTEKNLNKDLNSAYTAYMYKIEIGKKELIINPDELVKMTKSYEFIEPMTQAPVLIENITYIPFNYAERMIERADNGLQSPADRYNLQIVYSGTVFSIKYPIDGYYQITQGFGKRVHPITGEEKFHSGIDFKAEEGADVRAGMSGIVTDYGFDSEKGNYVVIQNENGVQITYCHLSHVSKKDIYPVEADDVVGKVGNTGKSTGAHLHMEVKINDEYVNPEMYLEESYYDDLLISVNRGLSQTLDSEGYPESDYEIISVECNMESITPSAVVKVKLKNYDNAVVDVLYSYYDTLNGWMCNGIVPETIASIMLY